MNAYDITVKSQLKSAVQKTRNYYNNNKKSLCSTVVFGSTTSGWRKTTRMVLGAVKSGAIISGEFPEGYMIHTPLQGIYIMLKWNVDGTWMVQRQIE